MMYECIMHLRTFSFTIAQVIAKECCEEWGCLQSITMNEDMAELEDFNRKVPLQKSIK